MIRDSFPAGVTEQLKWYVYRLIDPRNDILCRPIVFLSMPDSATAFSTDEEDKEDATDLDETRNQVQATLSTDTE